MHRVWRAPETSAEELERLCGSPDHQGVVAEVDPYPYGDPKGMLRQEDALIVALDQVQDPRNLGAVCRSAEFAGAAGVVDPRAPRGRGHRGHLQGLGGGGRAPARSPTSGTSPTGSAKPRRPASGSGAPTRRPSTAPWSVDLTGPTVLVLGGEGKGLRPRVAASCDGLVALPQRGKVESLNVSAAASALLFEALRQRVLSRLAE